MIKVKDVLSVEEISALPSWVKADIENAVFVEGSNISIEILFLSISTTS